MTQAFTSYKITSKPCLVYSKDKLQQERCRLCIYKLKSHKTVKITYLKITKEQARYRLTYLKVLKLKQRYGWCFWRPNDSMKGKCDVFIGYKQTSKLDLVYLESKLAQDRYGWCICKLKCQKTIERRYLETNKQQTKYYWCF